MHSLYKFLLLFLAASALLSCERKQVNNPINVSPDSSHKIYGFARDTSAYAMVIDTTVREKDIVGELILVNQGGFTEYFKDKSKEGTNAKKVFYAYSDSTSPFIRKSSSREMSFINLVASAYAAHNSIEINPDDIWLTILNGIRLHVKNNRDSLKDRFVSQGADTAIEIRNDSLSRNITYEEWHGVIADLFDSLQEKIPVETGEPLNVKFSTTSPIDYNISRSLVMAVASEYYTYTWAVACGIPQIKVNGTKLDWSLLKDSFNKLASRLNLEWWVKELNPILDEFINVFDGKINLIHWRSIFKKVFEESGCDRRITVDGWITKFYPYIGRDKPERRNEWNGAIDLMTDIPKGVTDVDINWIYAGKTIPLKIYTGFVGIQVDTTRKMLKASRGYALMSYCGWCDMDSIAKDLKYIPGKPLRLQESLAISDSIEIYNAQGVAYATSDPKEIKNFAAAASFKSEIEKSHDSYPYVFDEANIANAEPFCVINLYKGGKIIEHLSLYKQIEKKYVVLTQEIGILNDSLSLESFFKERHISFEGEFNGFTNDKSIPELDVDVFVDSFEPKAVEDDFVYNFNQTIVWRIKKAFYQHYKNDFKLSVDAKLEYGENGQVANVIMNTEHPKYNAFLEDVKDALYYAWNAPLLDDDGGNDFIIKSAKLHLSFSRKYRMVCKQDGRDAKDSVDIIGVPNAKKDLCNEITFSKDLATGGVVRYECIEYNKKMKYGERVEEIEPRHTNVLFDKHDDGSLPISQVVTLKIPPCFVKY
ncbi:MAG: DUF4419 domain-containing protein [Fibrobacter sp.]|nr:DUF4419 domain-containing protein [Fibrobacter sp.]